MRTIETLVYEFHELSETAQQRAYEKSLDSFEMSWTSENSESLAEFCREFPVTAKDWSYGNAASISSVIHYGEYEKEVWELSGLRLRTWLLNNFHNVLYKGKYIHLPIQGRHVFKYSKAMIEESCCPFTGYCMDDTLMDPIWGFIRKPDNRTLEDILGECLWSWVQACQKDYEWQTSFDAFKEDCEANKWEFTEDGEMI